MKNKSLDFMDFADPQEKIHMPVQIHMLFLHIWLQNFIV